MPSIGETLREARMRQRIDVSEVEARTKIRAKYLRALENEEFDVLPGATFAKSFLRTYAEFLGLDGHLLVEEYRTRHEEIDETEAQPLAPSPGPPPPSDRRRRPPPGRGAVAIGLAVALLGLLLVLGLTGGDGEEDPAGGGGEATERETRAERARERRARARERRRAQIRRRRRAAGRRVTLRIAPVDATYACIDTGPGTEVLFEGTLVEPRTFRGRRLRLNLGRASAAVTVNGRRLPIPETANPVGFDFQRNEREELPVGQRPCA